MQTAARGDCSWTRGAGQNSPVSKSEGNTSEGCPPDETIVPLHSSIMNYFQSPFTVWCSVFVSLLCDSILLEMRTLCAWCLLLFAGALKQGEPGACMARRWASSEWSRSPMQISAYLPPGFCEASKFRWIWFSSPDSSGLCFHPHGCLHI